MIQQPQYLDFRREGITAVLAPEHSPPSKVAVWFWVSIQCEWLGGYSQSPSLTVSCILWLEKVDTIHFVCGYDDLLLDTT
jgi:hypothetical protein